MMLKPLLALSALSLPVAALTAQSPTAPVQPAQWTLAGGAQGCAVHATSPQGTVMSILAGAGQQNLVFLVQNPRWSSLEDGQRYDIAVEFDDAGPWQMQAVAKTEIDQDGPGLMFVVPASDQRGLDFIAEFVKAGGMQIESEGRSLTSLPIGSGQSAMTALARCMSQQLGGGEATSATTSTAFEGAGPAIRI
jgi:hypothetical protein